MEVDSVDEIFAFMQELAIKCGKVVKSAFYQPKTVETKESEVDLVTETDKLVEDMIISSVMSKYPKHKIIGEESTAAGVGLEFTNDPTWILDPVDGTTNFVCGFPYVAVCIGFSINKVVQCAVVLNPLLDEMFHAKKGAGAFLNTTRISINDTTTISKSLLLSGFGASRDEKRVAKAKKNLYDIAMNPCRGVRFIGSTACAICMVACGRGDAYFGAGFHIWDIAAAGLILTEAGGTTVDMKGQQLNLLNRQIIGACTSSLAAEIATKITQINDVPDGST